MVATYLFELHGVHYLLIGDYFSRSPEVSRLTTTTSAAVITAMKAVFARHSILEVLRSDNGPQYSSHEFVVFAKSYGFQHCTRSPLYLQSNGEDDPNSQETYDQFIHGFANIQSNSTVMVWTQSS